MFVLFLINGRDGEVAVVKVNLSYIHRGRYPPVYETGSTVQAAFVDEADALFKML